MDEKAKLRRRHTSEAIALAMQSRWEEAVITNRSIIEIFPHDIDAHNRLGKALTELGQYSKAEETYKTVLEIDPNNSIAKRNLRRLSHLKEAQLEPKDGCRVDPSLFIEETGKAGLASLHNPALRETIAKMAAGDPVNLKAKGRSLVVESIGGEYLGEIEPRLGLRLIRLMEGGNQYAAAVARLGGDGVKVIVKEVFQHPSQAGRPSFPSRAADGFRPYVRDSMVKYELEEEESFEEGEYPSEWDDEIESLDKHISLIEDMASSLPEDEGEESEEEE